MTASEQELLIAESIWLKYYNQVLFEKGIITEEEKNKMIRLIDSRKKPFGQPQKVAA